MNIQQFNMHLEDSVTATKGIISFNTYNDECIPDPNVDGFSLKGRYGCLAYNATLDAMRKYPDFNGYLFAHDDIAINISNLITYDKSKVWLASTVYSSIPVLDESANATWWFRTVYGIHAIKLLYQSHYGIKQRMESCIDQNLTFHTSTGMSDVFYIPKQSKSLFLNIADHFLNSSLFLEIAIPTFGYYFVNEYCNTMRHWSTAEKSHNWRDMEFVHPVKISNSVENEHYIREKMSLQLF